MQLSLLTFFRHKFYRSTKTDQDIPNLFRKIHPEESSKELLCGFAYIQKTLSACEWPSTRLKIHNSESELVSKNHFSPRVHDIVCDHTIRMILRIIVDQQRCTKSLSSWQHNVQDGFQLQMVTIFGQKERITAAGQVVLKFGVTEKQTNINK